MAQIEEKGRLGTWFWPIGSSEPWWSPGLYRILGIDPATPASLELYSRLVHPDDLIDFGDPARAAADGSLSLRQFRVLRPDGVLAVIRSYGQLVHSAEGEPLQMMGVDLDVTETWYGSVALRQQAGVFDALREMMGVHVWQTDANGRVIEPVAWHANLGPQVYNPSWWGRLDAVHPDDRERVAEAWRDAIANQRHYSANYRIRLDGRFVYVTSSARTVRGPTGYVEGWIGVTALPGEMPDSAELPAAEPVSPALIRAARGLLDWSLNDLALQSRLSFSTVRRAEKALDSSPMTDSRQVIRKTFEGQGVKFIRSGLRVVDS